MNLPRQLKTQPRETNADRAGRRDPPITDLSISVSEASVKEDCSVGLLDGALDPRKFDPRLYGGIRRQGSVKGANVAIVDKRLR